MIAGKETETRRLGVSSESMHDQHRSSAFDAENLVPAFPVRDNPLAGVCVGIGRSAGRVQVMLGERVVWDEVKEQ